MRKLLIRGELKFGAEATIDQVVKNTSSGNLVEGDVVVLDPANCTSTLIAITTTSSADDKAVYGMLSEAIVDNEYGKCLRVGLTDKLKVNGTANIAVGDYLSSYSAVGIGALATAGKGGVFAIALEAYTGSDSNGVIDAILFEPGRFDSTAGGNTLDASYNQGGSGLGRTITVDTNAVVLAGNEAAENIFEITNTAGSGSLIDLTNTTTGSKDIDGTGSAWSVTGDGVAVFDSINTVGVIKIASDTLGTGSTMIGYDGTDFIINALTGKSIDLQINDTNVVTIVGSGITVTGNALITGNLDVTGSLAFGGDLTVGATLTVDELILDTDGSISSLGGSTYVISDNTGDLNINALTGQSVILQVNGSDEYDFSSTILTMNSNHIATVGYIDMAAVTISHGDNVRVGHDNGGDLVLNARNVKDINFSINGTDQARVKAGELELASGTDLQFLGNDGILDSSGAELIKFTATGSAINYLQVINSTTGDPITLQCLGTDDKGFMFEAVNDEELLELAAIAAATDYLQITSGTTSTHVQVSVAGSTANMGIVFLAKGTAGFTFNNGTDPVVLQLLGAQAGYNNEIQDVNGAELISLQGVASATTEISISNATTGTTGPIIGTSGETNVNLRLAPNGTGQLDIVCGTPGTASRPDIVIAGDVNTGIFAAGADKLDISTGGTVRTNWSVTGQKVGGTADHAGTAGTNCISIFNGTSPAGTLANGATLYVAAGEMYARDATDTASQITPHNSDGDFVINSYSSVKGKTLKVNLEQLAHKLAEKFPQDFAEFIEVLEGDQLHN